MKSILFLITAIVISIMISSFVMRSNDNITLQATGKNVTPELLKQSGDIISARLKQFGINPELKIVTDKNQILVVLPGNISVSVEGLLVSRGELSFYETYTHAEISNLLKPDNQLFSLLKSDQNSNPADPRVGCTTGDKDKAETFLHSSVPVKNCKLLWGKSEKSGYCLFALKTDQEGKPLLVRSDIESVKMANMNGSQDFKIQIKLNPAATKVFADATERDLNKSIAIVIDNQVYSWPLVRSAIKEGEIEVTGNFTKNEANYFPVVFNSPQLPLDFKILK